LLIAFPNADDPPSGNHESLETKIPKRKKARPNTRLSCKIKYFIQTTFALSPRPIRNLHGRLVKVGEGQIVAGHSDPQRAAAHDLSSRRDDCCAPAEAAARHKAHQALFAMKNRSPV
jgi:hypothetical protein